MNAFLIELGQAGQEWYAQDPKQFVLYISAWSAGISFIALALWKFVALMINGWWDSRDLWKKRMEQSVGALSRGSNLSTVTPTEDDKALIQKNAVNGGVPPAEPSSKLVPFLAAVTLVVFCNIARG